MEHTRPLRQTERLDIVLPARCRSRTGFVDRVVITDISIGGCRIESRAITMREGDMVMISPGVIEGLCGKVMWVNGHRAGIAFASPLYAPVVDHLHHQYARFLAPARQDGRSLRAAA